MIGFLGGPDIDFFLRTGGDFGLEYEAGLGRLAWFSKGFCNIPGPGEGPVIFGRGPRGSSGSCLGFVGASRGTSGRLLEFLGVSGAELCNSGRSCCDLRSAQSASLDKAN